MKINSSIILRSAVLDNANLENVLVETNLSSSLPSFSIVGLADTSVKESKDRIYSALINSGFSFPLSKIVVNLSPSGKNKKGTLLDLPIALSIILSRIKSIKENYDEIVKCNQVVSEDLSFKYLDFYIKNEKIVKKILGDYVILGEISLLGELRDDDSILALIIELRNCGFKNFILPEQSKDKMKVITGVNFYFFNSFLDCICFLLCVSEKNAVSFRSVPMNHFLTNENEEYDFKDVIGQDLAKRAILIAASGMHNIIMWGPPGNGKSMLSKRITSILPDLSYEEMLETTKIYSIAKMLKTKLNIISKRPFRSPHHSSSATAILGGGPGALPGEISLSHNGVLFLDELTEFSPYVLNNLREPLENGYISILRAKNRNTYPSKFMLVGALNPCPCGYLNHPTIKCTCTDMEKRNYIKKLSGPLLDRVDIRINVPVVDYKKIEKNDKNSLSSKELKEIVLRANKYSYKRNKKYNFIFNKDIPDNLIGEICVLDEGAKKILNNAYGRYSFTLRGINKILKVSRTIADIDCEEIINEKHILEAINYRSNIN